MNKIDALKIIILLREGVDPHTGEKLPMDSVYQNPETVRALNHAVNAMKPTVKRESRRNNSRFPSFGKKWLPEEINRLVEEFKAKKSIEEIAEIHGRNIGGIRSRLVKLGLIEQE